MTNQSYRTHLSDMILDLLEPRTEPRWSAFPSPRPALNAARPMQPADLPQSAGAPAAHASPQAWAAPGAGDSPAARLARILCALVRASAEGSDPGPPAEALRTEVLEGWALGAFSVSDPDTAALAAAGVASIAMARARAPDGIPSPIVRELAFGVLRALGVADSLAAEASREAAREILIPPN